MLGADTAGSLGASQLLSVLLFVGLLIGLLIDLAITLWPLLLLFLPFALSRTPFLAYASRVTLQIRDLIAEATGTAQWLGGLFEGCLRIFRGNPTF